MKEGRAALKANPDGQYPNGYGIRKTTLRLRDTPKPLFSDYQNLILDLRDFGLRSLQTVGNIDAGSNRLRLQSAPNPPFQKGDYLIVELGGEAGRGLRGTMGVGGTWPAKSYPTAAARDAERSQPLNTFAWIESDGTVRQWYSSKWNDDTSYVNPGGTLIFHYYRAMAAPRANSRSDFEAWLTGLEAANGIAMMFGVHGAEEIGGGFVMGFVLAGAPVHEQTVAETAKHSHHAHGLGLAHAALVVEVGDIQSLVQAALNAPSRAVVLEPLRRVELLGGKTGHQSDGFRGMVAQMAAQEGDLLHAGKVHFFGGGRPRTQHPDFGLAFVELTAARQSGRGLRREKNRPAAPGPTGRCSGAKWAGCL